MNNKLILTCITAVLLLAGLASCDDHGKVTPQNQPSIKLYIKGFSFGEPLYAYVDNTWRIPQMESNAIHFAPVLRYSQKDKVYHISLVKSSDTTQVVKEFDLPHPEVGEGFTKLVFYKYIYDGEQLISGVVPPEKGAPGFTRAKFMLRLDVSQYTEPVDLLFYYLPAKANRSDRYTRREINRMTDIEYVAKLENVKPSRTEFSEAVDIPLRKDSVTMGGAIYRTQWLHVDVVKAGTDELVWAVDGVAAGRFFEPTFLGEYDKMPVGGKSGKGETLYDQDACMYILQEERIGTTGKFGKFTFFDIEPYTTWRGWDEFGETIQ